MTQNATFGMIFLKILFRAYVCFYICLDVPVDIIRVYFNFRFSSRKSQSQQKLTKKITHFTIQFRSKNFILRTLTHLTLKIISTRNKTKTFWLYEFSNIFCLVPEKNICIKLFLDAQELHSWSTLKANVCIFWYDSKFFFKKHSKVLPGGGRTGGGYIISLRALAVWVLQCFTMFLNILQYFILIKILENLTHIDKVVEL